MPGRKEAATNQAAGEGAETIRRSGGGSVCEPGDPEALYRAMREYLEDPARADAHGAAGRSFVEKSFDRGAIARDFAALLAAASASGRD